MAIPEAQLATWSAFVDAPQSKRTADMIKDELTRIGTRVTSGEFRVYLQGSYRNSTNIRRDSDVDIVVELMSIFSSDLSQLPDWQKKLQQAAYSDATLTLQEFRNQVLLQLQQRFPGMVTDGNKAIKVGGDGQRLNADVLVCNQFRHWTNFEGSYTYQHNYHKGIVFRTQKEGRQVINFPDPHYDNGVSKHQNSREWFKPTVRMIKNARRQLYEQGVIRQGSAPSYFVQCLLYNVPDGCFGNTNQESYRDVLEYLESADLSGFVCQNGIQQLFGPSPDQWDELEARQLIRGLRKLWDEWYL